MTDTTAPISNIRNVVFWAEVPNQMGDKTLQPVRAELQVQRLGYDSWEKIETVNMVPQGLAVSAADAQPGPESVEGMGGA